MTTRYLIYLLLTAVFAGGFCAAQAQQAADSIYLHSGKVIGGVVSDSGAGLISYRLNIPKAAPITKVISRWAILRIVYASGSLEEPVSQPVKVVTAADWIKVVVLKDEREAVGLVYAAEVQGLGGGRFIEAAQAEASAATQLRMAAAKAGCPFVCLKKTHIRNTGYVGRRFRMTGVAYRY